MTFDSAEVSSLALTDSSVLPEEWSSDEKMAALFGPLHLPFNHSSEQLINYNNKVNFWQNLIVNLYAKHAVLSKKSPTCSLNSLKSMMCRKGIVPMGMETVVKEMVQRQILVPLESFGSRACYSWGVWFKSILSGVIGALSERSQRAMPEDKVYVIFPVAKERSERLVEQIKSIYQSKRHVFTLEELEKTLKINYLKVLVPLLPVTVFKVKGKCCLKFYTDEAEKKVNEVDLGILSLCSTIEYLNERMQIVSSSIKETHEKILEAFSSKSVAIHLLRRKKRFERMLEQICKVQERLEEILTKIEQGKLSYEIFEVLQTGSSALNQMTDKVVVDQLYDLKESLTDVMDRYEEIESVGVLGADEPSEEEEEELRELLKRTKDGGLSPVELTADEAEIRDVHDTQEDELINELAQLSVVKEGELLEKVG